MSDRKVKWSSERALTSSHYYQTIEELEEDRRRGIPQIAIGEGAVIRHAIIDKNARIGMKVHIINEAGLEHHDGPNYCIRDGIVVIPKNATIPDGTII
jgi:glucose-1-phosphate adenylyltransferase